MDHLADPRASLNTRKRCADAALAFANALIELSVNPSQAAYEQVETAKRDLCVIAACVANDIVGD